MTHDCVCPGMSARLGLDELNIIKLSYLIKYPFSHKISVIRVNIITIIIMINKTR